MRVEEAARESAEPVPAAWREGSVGPLISTPASANRASNRPGALPALVLVALRPMGSLSGTAVDACPPVVVVDVALKNVSAAPSPVEPADAAWVIDALGKRMEEERRKGISLSMTIPLLSPSGDSIVWDICEGAETQVEKKKWGERGRGKEGQGEGRQRTEDE